jgi:glycosyltransferase involved in cell wall biosynthesis
VPEALRHYPPSGGAGKMWREVLGRLGESCDVVFVGRPGTDRVRRTPDVWLSDGHQGPLPVREPSVIQLQEATWNDPVVRPLLDPSFVATYEGPSAEAATRATRIITPSESSRRQVLDCYGADPARVHTVPLGVDASLFRPGLHGGAELVAAAGLAAGMPYVVFASVIHPRKNLGALRQAMDRLVAKGFPHGLVLLANPPADRADADQLIAEAVADLPSAPGRVVRLAGVTEEQVAAVLADAAAFCLPSLMEGFGLTVLEAMACGTPVVASDRGSVPEIVADAGVVAPPTAEAIEGALARVLSDDGLARAFGAAARRRSLQLSWDATAAGFLGVLQAAAGRA